MHDAGSMGLTQMALVQDVIEQLAARTELGYDVEALGVLVKFVDFNDIWVVLSLISYNDLMMSFKKIIKLI